MINGVFFISFEKSPVSHLIARNNVNLSMDK